MTKFYGNLADTALGERRFSRCIHKHLRTVSHRRPKQATRVLAGLALAIIGLTALAILGTAPDRFAAAAPVMADLEDWLMWRDLLSY